MYRSGIAALLLTAVVCGAPASAFAQAVAKGKNELGTDVFFITSKPTTEGDDERLSRAEIEASYARFITDRFAAGPLFKVSKGSDSDTLGYLGAQGRYYFGDLHRRAIPVVEVSTTRTFNDPIDNHADLQVLAGLMIPMGSSGGRIRIAPYYYRAFYNEDAHGTSSFQSFGISWSLALLF